MLSGRRDRGLQAIDLRRSSAEESGSLPSSLRLFYTLVLLLTGASTLLALGIEVPLSFRASRLPADTIRFDDVDLEHRAGWRIDAVWPGETGLRDRDLVVSLNGTPAERGQWSGEGRREVDRALRRGAALEAVVVRRPRVEGTMTSVWTLAGISGFTSQRDALHSVVLDSLHPDLGLAEALRAFDPSAGAPCPDGAAECGSPPALDSVPPGIDLTAAQAALEAHDPSLSSLPVGSTLHAALVGSGIRRPVVAVTRASGEGVQVERTQDGWIAIPVGTLEREIQPRIRPWRVSLYRLSRGVAILFVAVVGLLALRARSNAPAVRYFVALACLLSVGGFQVASEAWTEWARPFVAQIHVEQGSVTVAALVGSAAILLCLFTFLLLRLLQVFPAVDRDLASRFGIPRRGIIGALAAATLLLWAAEWSDLLLPDSFAVQMLVFSAVFVILTLMVMAVQILRLAVVRVRESDTGEEGQQARMALLGVAAGAALVLVGMLLPAGYSASMPSWAESAYQISLAAKQVLVPAGLLLPFVGFFLAIVKRGLWNVDLIVKRATLYSVLTTLFLGLWLTLEALLEGFVAERLAGVPAAGGLLPALVAGGVVAVSQRSVDEVELVFYVEGG